MMVRLPIDMIFGRKNVPLHGERVPQKVRVLNVVTQNQCTPNFRVDWHTMIAIDPMEHADKGSITLVP